MGKKVEYLTVKQLCALFGRSRQTIWRWQREKGMPTRRIPGDGVDAVRFNKAKVLAWAKANGISPLVKQQLEQTPEQQALEHAAT